MKEEKKSKRSGACGEREKIKTQGYLRESK